MPIEQRETLLRDVYRENDEEIADLQVKLAGL